MKIKAHRTIALIIFNGKLGLVTEKYWDKWTIEAGMDSWNLEQKDFIPIINLRKKVDRGLYTPDEIIRRHKVAIMNALMRKVVSLAELQLRETI